MKLKRVLIATKKTALEHFKEADDDYRKKLPREELEKIKTSHDAHYASLALIRNVLAKRGISFDRTYLPYSEYEDFKNRDIVIAVGGDGTVLNASHYILDETPVLSVRSDKSSYGALCEINASEIESALHAITKGDNRIEKWTRVDGRFRNKRVLSLNEIFVGDKYNPGMAHYELSFRSRTENQRSSGVVISTGTGSTGWYNNITGSVGPFSRTSKELRFIVREYGQNSGYKLTKGTLRKNEVLTMRSLMNIDGGVSFDGDKRKRFYSFDRGELLEARIAKEPLYAVIL